MVTPGSDMDPKYFLLALDLEDRRTVLFGSSEEVLARARVLLDHGALVDVVSPAPSAELRGFADAVERVTLHEREPLETDLDDAWLAVLVDPEPAWNAWLGPLAKKKRVLFCAIDRPLHNTFAHVGVARAGSLQVGVSTSGVVPGIAGSIRRELQKLLDESHFAAIVERFAEARRRAPADQRSALLREMASRIRLEGRLFLDES